MVPYSNLEKISKAVNNFQNVRAKRYSGGSSEVVAPSGKNFGGPN